MYGATKAFTSSFGKALSHELKGTGVTVTIVLPGATTGTEFASTSHTTHATIFNLPAGLCTEDASAVARTAVRATLKGEEEIVSGWHNELYALGTRLVPEKVAMLISLIVFTPLPLWARKKRD